MPKLADIGLVAGKGANTLIGTPGDIPLEGPGAFQADIFSLGKVIYEMASGNPATDFPSPAIALTEPGSEQQMDHTEIINKACDPAPTMRYRISQELGEDL